MDAAASLVGDLTEKRWRLRVDDLLHRGARTPPDGALAKLFLLHRVNLLYRALFG